MSASAIVTSHDNPAGLRHILGTLRYQTRPPDEIIVLHSGTEAHEIARLQEEFPEAEFVERPDHNDWGHDKRAHGLLLATEEWLGFFNDDDTYSERYLQELLARIDDEVDVVYCNWNVIPDCGFQTGSSTSGNFIVRSYVAREAEYTSRNYDADGHFINAVAALARRTERVDDILYFHNEGIQKGS